MTDPKIVRWCDSSNLSKGFVIDLENISVAQVFISIYQRPEELISAFADCFLLMRFAPEDAESLANELYNQTRSQFETMIDRLRSKPYARVPATHNIQ